MGKIEKISEWLRGFPGFEGRYFAVDCLPDGAGGVSLDSVPTGTLVRRYFDGSERKKLSFIIAGREYLDSNAETGSENAALFEALEKFIGEKNRCGELPELEDGETCLGLTVTASAYPISVDGHGTARYQLACRIDYYREGHR
ncbi:MAG: hypothetical protein HUJ65_03930 [Oscillospiraceae bacterium]|nr:hypothetical protein [Oscillospiraceae bacterium]